MAAVTQHAAANTLTPPSSDHEEETSWNANAGHNRADSSGDKFPTSRHDFSGHKSPTFTGNSTARRMQSADNLGRRERAADGTFSPTAHLDKNGRASPAEWPMQQQPGPRLPQDSHWIHRDKLARIENQELRAAGIFIPRQRAPSKQRREPGQNRLRKGTDASEQSQEDHLSTPTKVPAWDLRTPEEIAEEEANAYFTSSGLSGGTRIPLAKTSPAPIPIDYLERGSPAARRLPDMPPDEPLLYQPKTRSRSASVSLQEVESVASNAGKRSVTDSSPKKPTTRARKASHPKTPPSSTLATSKTKAAQGSNAKGPGKDNRPSSRSGALPKEMEGEPPWAFDKYKPDPRLPPDQQLLPTVARRLQQEKWEKEGKFGDIYDTEFRPLNDRELLRPFSLEKTLSKDDHPSDQWPLGAEPSSKTTRQGSYSTMPKIADKPATTPLGSPKNPQAPQTDQPPQEQMEVGRMPQEAEEKKQAGGCGCCVVM